MATRFTVNEVLEAIFDDEFGLSDGEPSDEEGEGICGYLGEPVLHRAEVEELGEAIVGGPIDDHHEDGIDLGNPGDVRNHCASYTCTKT